MLFLLSVDGAVCCCVFCTDVWEVRGVVGDGMGKVGSESVGTFVVFVLDVIWDLNLVLFDKRATVVRWGGRLLPTLPPHPENPVVVRDLFA